MFIVMNVMLVFMSVGMMLFSSMVFVMNSLVVVYFSIIIMCEMSEGFFCLLVLDWYVLSFVYVVGLMCGGFNMGGGVGCMKVI